MKNISKQQEDNLIAYLDDALSPSEKEHFEQELSASPVLQQQLAALQNVTRVLKNTPLEHPSKNFTQRVMNGLNQYPVRSGLPLKNGILLLIGVMIAVGIASFLLAAGVFDASGSIDLNNMVLQNKYIPESLPSIPVNTKLIINIIIMLNIALAFLVLDRAVLKPWFERRTRMNL
ncbi:MAG: hypothetical protein KF845_06865 [Cyclobacteriaceae bacterium]|nr:hypothetical protein [Cyclobacteriaceae bacterium]